MIRTFLPLLLLGTAGPEPSAAAAPPAAPAEASPPAAAEPYEAAVIVVNGRAVTRSYLALTIGSRLEELEKKRSAARAAGGWSEGREAEYREARSRLWREGVRSLVFGELLRLEAEELKKHGFNVTERMIDDYWRDMLRRSGGPAELASQRGLSVAALRDLAKDELMAEAYRRYLASRLARPTPEEILKYYRTNSEKFTRPESVRARAICVRRFLHTEDGRRVERTGALARAREVLELARKSPADFARLAERYSEDAESAGRGGLLGEERHGFLVESAEFGAGDAPLARALFSLKPGEVSDVIEAAANYYVVTVLERLPKGALPLKEIEEYVTSRCQAERAEKVEADLFRKLYPKLLVTDGAGRKIEADEFFGGTAGSRGTRKLRINEGDEPAPPSE